MLSLCAPKYWRIFSKILQIRFCIENQREENNNNINESIVNVQELLFMKNDKNDIDLLIECFSLVFEAFALVPIAIEHVNDNKSFENTSLELVKCSFHTKNVINSLDETRFNSSEIERNDLKNILKEIMAVEQFAEK